MNDFSKNGVRSNWHRNQHNWDDSLPESYIGFDSILGVWKYKWRNIIYTLLAGKKIVLTINIVKGKTIVVHNFGDQNYVFFLKTSTGAYISPNIITSSDDTTITIQSNVAYNNAKLILI